MGMLLVLLALWLVVSPLAAMVVGRSIARGEAVNVAGTTRRRRYQLSA